MIRRRSLAEQIAGMSAAAPYLRETARCDWLAIWRGPLRPLQRSYVVTITYVMRHWIGDLRVMGAYQPVVRLMAPTLQVVHPDTGECVPHVWRDWVFPERSELCLYDPVAKEWSSAALIADTIVPWACDWLACYEGWLATGEWTGGGRHPGDAPAAQAA